MSDKLTQDMADKTDVSAVRHEETTASPHMTEERPRPDELTVVTVGPEEASAQDDYAAIRAAALAMSGVDAEATARPAIFT